MIKIANISRKPNLDALETHKKILERIESGEITQISYSYVTIDGCISGDFCAGENNILMWAALGHCEREFYDQFLAMENEE